MVRPAQQIFSGKKKEEKEPFGKQHARKDK